MKKLAILLLLLLHALAVTTAQRIRLVRSRPFSLLVFARAAGGDVHLSRTLAAYIREHISRQDSARFYTIVADFSAISLETSYVFPGYPAHRQKPRSIAALINNAAIRSQDMDAFYTAIAGILPNEQWLELQKALNAIAPYHDRLMGQYESDMDKQLQALSEYAGQAGSIFHKLRAFYGSTWSQDVPFTISLYAIPGKTGNTTAAPYSNTLALGVCTDETIHEERMAVALHEVCHVLYEEQPLRLQQHIDSLFGQNTSPGATFAYNYLDEALATACGNGWAYSQLAGHEDTGSWYANRYINSYGKALYPLVKKYIEAGRQIDKAFISKAIAIFEKTFPDAVYEYDNLLNYVSIFTDANSHRDFTAVCRAVGSHFQITRSNGYYPISEPETRDKISNETGTLLFIIYRNHRDNYAQLKKEFPEIASIDPLREGLISFFDKKKRAIVIINAANIARVEKVAALMERVGKVDREEVFRSVE